MGRTTPMTRKFVCEICDQDAPPTDTPRVCLDRRCRRSKLRSKLYHERRQTPICEWCEDPIQEPRKRRYHDECRADKNRERVRLYNATHQSSPGPRKSRTFKGRLSCIVCERRVRRTGARQVACKDTACKAALKRLRKREARGRRNELSRLRLLKQTRDAERCPPRRDGPVEPVIYRTMMRRA